MDTHEHVASRASPGLTLVDACGGCGRCVAAREAVLMSGLPFSGYRPKLFFLRGSL